MRVAVETQTPPREPAVHRLTSYILGARWAVVFSAPLLYAVLIAFLLLDALASLYQAVCFPIYGIPKARRADYLNFDRARLAYLNGLERLNCYYCSYANGLLAYVAEIAARTEQHWCPIRHARQPKAPHSRYDRFLPYGDAHAYRERAGDVCRDFADLDRSTD